jgi:hypothetical protein
MTPLEQALHQIVAALDRLGIDYALIGGLANAIWGEPRATIDVDVTVAVDDQAIPAALTSLATEFRLAVPDPVTFVAQTRVLPLDTADGVRIDVIFALLPFELAAINRAHRVPIAGGSVRVVSAEDLILMKIISERERDVADAEAIVRRRGPALDRGYLEPRLRELADALEREDVLERWRQWTSD